MFTKSILHFNKILEIGSGTGYLLKNLHNFSDQIEAIDLNQKAIRMCKSNLGSIKANFMVGDFLKMENIQYDLIIGLEIFEHIRNDLVAYKKVFEKLNNNGLLIMSVPAHKNKWSVLDEWAGHYHRYERDQLIKMLKQLGFNIEVLYSYGFPLLNLLSWIRKKIIIKKTINKSKNINTQTSGINRNLEKKFKLFFSDIFILPFYFLQLLFLNFDFSTSYLLIAKKIK